jgi:hypothetical protein
MLLLQEVLSPPLWYQDPYHIPQILRAHHYQVQCRMGYHHLKFLVGMHTIMGMDRVIHQAFIQ